jgi:hypothetical protein
LPCFLNWPNPTVPRAPKPCSYISYFSSCAC